MSIPANIDWFNLEHLCKHIDEGCKRIIKDELPEALDRDRLKAVKVQMKDEVIALFTEMTNDWKMLHSKYGLDLLAPGQKIPNVSEIAERLEGIYKKPEATGDSEADRQAERLWRERQLRWFTSLWLQVWGHYLRRLSDDDSQQFPVNSPLDAGEVGPLQLDQIFAGWELVRSLTIEYLENKCFFLQAVGQDVAIIAVDRSLKAEWVLAESERAFWDYRYDTGILQLQALRIALLDSLGLRTGEVMVDLRNCPTTALIRLAVEARAILPFAPEVLGNIAATLEVCFQYCTPPVASMQYSFGRIISETVTKLGTQEADVLQRVQEILIKRTNPGNVTTTS